MRKSVSTNVCWREYNPDIRLVAEVGGSLAGFVVDCFVVEEHDRSVLSLRRSGEQGKPYRQVGWIDMIGVRPDSQGLRVGSRLVEALCEECSRAKVDVRAVTTEDDQKLKQFLESAGFRPENLSFTRGIGKRLAGRCDSQSPLVGIGIICQSPWAMVDGRPLQTEKEVLNSTRRAGQSLESEAREGLSPLSLSGGCSTCSPLVALSITSHCHGDCGCAC